MKKYVLEHYPELIDLGSGEEAIRALARALEEAWNALPNSLFESLIVNTPKRVNALWKAKGWKQLRECMDVPRPRMRVLFSNTSLFIVSASRAVRSVLWISVAQCSDIALFTVLLYIHMGTA